MPYGSGSISPNSCTVSQWWYEYGSLTDHSTSRPNTHPVKGDVIWSRSGTNYTAGKIRDKVLRPDPRPLERVIVSVPNGPRLPYKVYSKRLKRLVWARKPILVYKFKRVGPYPKRKPKKRGLDIPPNALSFQKSTFSTFGDGLTVISSGEGGNKKLTMSGNLWSNFAPYGGSALTPNPQNYTGTACSSRFDSAATSLDTECLRRLYAKVKNQDVNLAVALAEYRQSASMLVDMLTRAGRALLMLKRGNIVGAFGLVFPKTKKDLANDWLMWTYGIKPLLSDIDGAAKHLAVPESRTFDIVVRKKVALPREMLWNSSGTSGIVNYKTAVYSDGFVEVVYKVRLKINSIDRDLSRLGFGNLNSVAWEVIPFSFIADWVLPVGDFLNNEDAFSGLTVVNSHKTVFKSETISYLRDFGGSNSGFVTTSGQCGFVVQKVNCDRVVNITIPKQPAPAFKNPFSSGHLANALALFTQLKR